MNCILTLALLMMVAPLVADELVIIQTISGSKKTFVISKGRKDNIAVGQESLFSSEDASIKAKAIESSRHYSLWKVTGKSARVPFAKKEYVNFSPSVEKVWSEISHLSRALEQEQEDFARLGTRHKSAWMLRSALTTSLSETVSGTSPTQASNRRGIQFEFLYGQKLFQRIEWMLGVRYDTESITIKNPSLVIPTYRYYGVAELIYHFPKISLLGNKTYIGLGVAYGQSSTRNANNVSSGITFAIPLRLGMIMPLFSGASLTVEAVAESIFVNEDFANGAQQSTNMINGKLAVGLKF